MANNYDFLFKFIIIGDSSNLFPQYQVSVNLAYSYALLKAGSSRIISQPSASSSELKIPSSTTSA